MTKPLTIFVDTNCFLQMCDFNQVDWKAVFVDAKEIDIHVCEAVIRELDVHKVSQSERRRKRARAALRTIEAASQDQDGLILKDIDPKLRMHVSLERIEWDAIDLPPSDEPDDMLVAAARQASSAAIVLSHDTGPRIKARKIGLAAHEPPEEWLLKPEPSEESRRLGKLEKEVQSLKRQSPDLRLNIVGLTQELVNLEAVQCPPLGKATVSQLTRFVIHRNPMKHISATRSGMYGLALYGDISQYDVDIYERAYSDYRFAVDGYFRRLHETVFFNTHLRALEVCITNEGSASARNLSVSVGTQLPLRLMANRNDGLKYRAAVSLPVVPQPPRGGILDRMSHVHDLSGLTKKPENPTRFRWANRPDEAGDTQGMKICQDFRPKLNVTLEFYLFVPKLDTEAPVWIEVSAEDQETLSEKFPVRFTEGRADWAAPCVLDALPEEVRLAFKSLGDDYDFAS